MLLTEHEGKQLFSEAGIATPSAQNLSVDDQSALASMSLSYPVVVKAQVFHGNRGLHGLIKKAANLQELQTVTADLFTQTDQNQQPITELLIEEVVAFDQQHFLAVTYDTRTRSLVAKYSPDGGEGMDDRGDSITSQTLSTSEPLQSFEAQPSLTPLVNQLREIVLQHDATLVEINPLVQQNEGWIALDAKVILDDAAAFRHPEWEQYPPRTAMGRPPTEREQAAHEASRSDHRGVAGESFFEFPGGTIGVLAAGGGASVLAMDALMAAGLKPANYTEHSGNPPREKVKKLADVILSIPNLEGLFVVGTNANFTDIYETMAGVIDSLLESPYVEQDFPVLIRRGGPRWEEAFAMIEERLAPTNVRYRLLGPDVPIVNTALEMKALMEAEA